MRYSEIREIAKEIRKPIEELAFSVWQDLDMTGWCAVASALLWRQIPSSSLVLMEFHESDEPLNHPDHCVVEHLDYIIDLTADQFDWWRYGVLVERKNKYLKRLPNVHRITKNKKALRFIETVWPKDQRPSTYFKEFSQQTQRIGKNKSNEVLSHI